jgi:Clp amino terminal domain, pathogenicity island component
MAYRGHDLDLRTARGSHRGSGHGDGDHFGNGPRHGAISVDETLLATCNHAYEAAVFHGSREVRLEHLIYALARVGAAAQILDELGIRPETLRREAALAIAAEIPSATAETRTDPVSSEDLETTLRRASERAAERGALAGVVDLLRAIVLASRDNATVALLTRASSDPTKLERWREEALRREPHVPAHPRPVHVADASPAILARIDALEQTLRGIASDSGSERRTAVDLLRNVQDAVASLHTAHANTMPALDRTDEVKSAIDTRVHDLSELVLALDERLAGMPQADVTALSEVATRLDRLEQRFQDQGAEFIKLEQRFQEQGHELAKSVTPALAERLSQLMSERLGEAETTLTRLADLATSPQFLAPPQAQLPAPEPVLVHVPAPSAEPPAVLVEKLDGMELAVRSHLQSAEEQAKTHERDLHEVYEALVKLGSNQQTLANNLNTWRLDTSGDVSIVSNRLERLEQTVMESLARISGELQMLRPQIAALERPAPVPRQDLAYREEAPQPGRWSFKRWLFGTSRALSPVWERRNPGPVRTALSRLRVRKHHQE